ncbi:hypothetical protein PR048_003164 [Dryococelus australis]|uniref:Uncharacterized protein n=1 Tax=Dryococelus australis TaxID=614101 RepID=A0ABQ9IM94_9NEOP|nr:hypothetical protein PR048_003164 [Dryococelus australis]
MSLKNCEIIADSVYIEFGARVADQHQVTSNHQQQQQQQHSFDLSRIEVGELTCGSDATSIILQEDEGLVDGSELDQYLPPGQQPPPAHHYLYPSSQHHMLWSVHHNPRRKSSDDDVAAVSFHPSETNNNNNSSGKLKKSSFDDPLALYNGYSPSSEEVAGALPSMRYHELQPTSLVKTEREFYHQGSSTTAAAAASSYANHLTAPGYFGGGNMVGSSHHHQYLPSYQHIQQRTLFGSPGIGSAEATWSNYG